MELSSLQLKRGMIDGMIIVGIDPAKAKHQAMVIDPIGSQLGKTFSFDVNANNFTMNHQCTVMSDSISMKVPGMPGGEDMAIILKRVPELNKESK